MAEPLKASFGRDKIDYCADLIESVHPLERREFVRTATDGFEDAELMARSQLICNALARTLPADRGVALQVLIDALDAERTRTGGEETLTGIEPFRYLPIVQFIRDCGLGHFELAMRAQYEVTQRFTAEFSIRPFLAEHTEATLDRLASWSTDPSEHVRRLVSEGTRPRLPWAPRLHVFVDDPAPVIALLERLVDDPSEYVRRSVANNLNDISKDHPTIVLDFARRWSPDDSHQHATQRRTLIRRGLRTLIKAGHPEALAVLGYGVGAALAITASTIEPAVPTIGATVRLSVTLTNQSLHPDAALVDFRVWFVKANGSMSPKVFKGTEIDLAPGAARRISRAVSVAQLSTRTHYVGRHAVDVVVNGISTPIGYFDLT